jgi:flagellar protein FlaG
MKISSTTRLSLPDHSKWERPKEVQAEDRELIRAVKKINEAELMGSGSELTFILDRKTKRPVVRIVDRETHEVVRQIPAEHVLRLASDLNQRDK